MVRTQYITIDELYDILGVSDEIENVQNKIYEASEVIEYNLNNSVNLDTSNAPLNIKLATAYQLQYMEINDLFDEYSDNNFTLGKFSMSNGGESSNSRDYFQLSSKARKYVTLSGYSRRNNI